MKNLSFSKTNPFSDVQLEQLVSIYPESVVLDESLSIRCVSHSILDATGYTLNELLGKSLSVLSHAHDLDALMSYKLASGCFQEEQVEIRTKSGGLITFEISGASFGSLHLLKLKNLDEINLIYDRVTEKTQELDRFVYLSAHALRGPLATIKGLTHLAKQTYDRAELDFILQQIDNFSESLDGKLHRLIYFAESDKAMESSSETVSLPDVFQTLAKIREDYVDTINLECKGNDAGFAFDHGATVISLLQNVAAFCLQQSRGKDHKLTLDVHANPHVVEIVFRASGFAFPSTLLEKMKTINFGYSEILNHPELINCYAAKKIMFKMKGSIQFVPAHSHEMVVLMTIPQTLTR